METKSGAKPSSVHAGLFASYGQLARRLLPAAQHIAFFNVDGVLEWHDGSSASEPAGDRLLAPLLEGGIEAQMARLSPTLVAAAIPVVLDGKTLSILLVHSPADAAQSERYALRELASTAAPLLDCMCRELGQLGRKAAKGATLSERTEELEWLFGLTESLHSNSNDPKAIQQLLGAAVERMKCCFGAVVVPEHGLHATYTSLVHIDLQAAGTFERITPFFMNFVQRRREPLIANKISTTPNMPQFKVLVIPIEPHKDKVIGYLAFLKQPAMPNFGRRQLFLGRHLGHQIGTLLESQYDLATGLLTRNAFEQDVARVRPAGTARIDSLLYLDIDRLHVINDTMGFDLGDEAIMRIADLLRPPALPDDVIAGRIGGDSFIVFMPNHDADEACARAEQVLAAARHTAVGPADNRVPLSLSCGVVRLASQQPGLSGPLATAEMACTSAKDHGGNRTEVYLDVDQSMMRRRHDMFEVGNLRNALANSRFCMYAQKIVVAGDLDHVHGLECLIRMVGADGKIIGPNEFMPSAQRYQMLQAIDHWVIAKTLRELKPYRSFLLGARISVAINISGQSMQDEAFIDAIERWLLDSLVAPTLIRFEITESAAISNLARAEHLIRKLRRHGCGFSLDDFGTGVNSMSYLKCLPVTCVKIDGSFTRDLLSNNRSDVVVQTIVRMAKSLDMECVAECVETQAIALRLHELGVDYIQGYIAHRPEPLRDVLESLKSDESQRLHQLYLAQ